MHDKKYMSVGELAKKMHTTVRTLQYYDKEKVLCPSSQSEGGRRLYTHKDMIKFSWIFIGRNQKQTNAIRYTRRSCCHFK